MQNTFRTGTADALTLAEVMKGRVRIFSKKESESTSPLSSTDPGKNLIIKSFLLCSLTGEYKYTM